MHVRGWCNSTSGKEHQHHNLGDYLLDKFQNIFTSPYRREFSLPYEENCYKEYTTCSWYLILEKLAFELVGDSWCALETAACATARVVVLILLPFPEKRGS